MSIYLNPTATKTAITTAIRNADKAENAGYTVVFAGVFGGVTTYGIIKPSNDLGLYDYVVSAHNDFATCDCEQGKREGYCKHIELAARYEGWIESVEARETEFDTNEEGRFFMEEIAAMNLSDTEGAWF